VYPPGPDQKYPAPVIVVAFNVSGVLPPEQTGEFVLKLILGGAASDTCVVKVALLQLGTDTVKEYNPVSAAVMNGRTGF
jgi:hypothetical protein